MEARATEDADVVTNAVPAEVTAVIDKEPASARALVVVSKPSAAKFGSAESALDKEVSADIEGCDRENGSEDFFASQEERIRRLLPAAYRCFRRATADPAYCTALAEKLLDASGGEYRPSAKKPANLAAHLALRPKEQRHVKLTYEAAYYYHHASIEDVSIEAFAKWIEGRNLKASRDFVRARTKKASGDRSKPVAYPNHAKARTLKGDDEVRDILKMAKDIAESDLAKLFAAREDAANNSLIVTAKAA